MFLFQFDSHIRWLVQVAAHWCKIIGDLFSLLGKFIEVCRLPYLKGIWKTTCFRKVYGCSFFRYMTWKSTLGKSNYFLRHCKFAKMECTMYYYVSFFLKNSFFNLILSLSSNLKIIWWVMLLWYENCLWKGMFPEGYNILFYMGWITAIHSTSL